MRFPRILGAAESSLITWEAPCHAAARTRSANSPRTNGDTSAGSAGPREPGGISLFQLESGRALADRLGVPYDSFGASVS